MNIRYKVVFKNPRRVFYVRAKNAFDAFDAARVIEGVYENPKKPRERTLTDAVIDAIQNEEDE
jgi:hypothetical protein